MRVKDAVGRFGEDAACRHVQALGLTLVERNWRCREGEIDVVARDADTLVIIEVKTRSSTAFGLPAEAITAAKAARLRRLAVRWIDAHRNTSDSRAWTDVRIDVISVVRRSQGQPEIEHYVGVI